MSTTINQPEQREMQNLLETAKSTGDFTVLIQAIEVAGLSDTFRREGQLTVFAPNDEAFRKLPTGTLEGLLKDLPKLKSILSYHVVNRKITLDELRSMSTDGRIQNLMTLQGSQLVVKTQKNILMKNEYVNDSKIVKPDIEASNGVIHAIDRVLIPSSS
jgi:transforming growth factor-beta-induced protein